MIKCKNYKTPSDFVRTEYVEYNDTFQIKVNQFLDNCLERAEHYDFMSDQIYANPVLSIDYLRRAYLITGDNKYRTKARVIFYNHKFDDQALFFIKNFLRDK